MDFANSHHKSINSDLEIHTTSNIRQGKGFRELLLFKKVWTDPVWSKVIAAGILACAGILITYFAGWWPAIVSRCSGFVSLLQGKMEIPNWLFALLLLCALVVLAGTLVVVWAVAFPSKSTASFVNYTEDTLFGVRWRWSYDRDIGILNLVPFCPHCDYQVQPTNISGFRTIDHFEFRCEECSARLGEFEMSWEEFISRVTRKIHQNIRNDTWLKTQKM